MTKKHTIIWIDAAKQKPLIDHPNKCGHYWVLGWTGDEDLPFEICRWDGERFINNYCDEVSVDFWTCFPMLEISNKIKKCKCRVCGCTDDNCRQCIEKTGQPCYWVEEDLCSACVGKE